MRTKFHKEESLSTIQENPVKIFRNLEILLNLRLALPSCRITQLNPKVGTAHKRARWQRLHQKLKLIVLIQSWKILLVMRF